MERLKILIVDDEKAITDICAMYLEHEGYEVFISNDGKDALEKIVFHNGQDPHLN